MNGCTQVWHSFALCQTKAERAMTTSPPPKERLGAGKGSGGSVKAMGEGQLSELLFIGGRSTRFVAGLGRELRGETLDYTDSQGCHGFGPPDAGAQGQIKLNKELA